MLIFRKIIFYIFALIYLVVCPIIILYAFGYIMKPNISEPMLETGTVYLSSTPPGASIYIDKELSPNTTPALFEKLIPKKYKIALFLEKHNVWTDTLTIKSMEAITLDKIILIPKEWKRQLISSDKFTDLFSIPKMPFFIAKRGKRLQDYLVFNYKTKEFSKVVDLVSPYADLKVINIFSVDGSGVIIFQVSQDAGNKFVWADLTENKITLEDVTNLFPEIPQSVFWDPSDKYNIFTFQKNFVNRLDVKEKAIYPDFVEHLRGFGVSNKLLYVLKDSNIIFSMNYSKNSRTKILEDVDLGKSIFGEEGNFKIMPFFGDTIIFLGTNGELLANKLPYNFVTSGVKGIAFDKDNKRVLFHQNDRVGIIDFLRETTGSAAFEMGPKVSWVFTGGKDIRQVFWAYDASHVIFLDGNTVFLLNTSPHGSLRPIDLFEVKKGSSIFYSDVTGYLYYIDGKSKEMVSTDILQGARS